MATTTTTAPHVYRAILGVMTDIGKQGVGKTKRNTQQNYDFRGIDDLMQALSPLLVKHELLILPKVLNRAVSEHPSKGGGTRCSSW